MIRLSTGKNVNPSLQGLRRQFKVLELKKSGQDKQASGVTVPPFIVHLHATVFFLEP